MSLRARILLLALTASVIPVLAMLWLLVENRALTLEQARSQLITRTEVLAGELDDKIAGTTQLLFGLGRVPVVGSPDKTACSAFLADVLKEHPQYTGLLTIKPDGHLHCDSLQTGRALQLNDRAYFRQALTARGAVVEPAIGRLTGKAVLQIAYPLRDSQDELRFILLASLNMDAYGRLVAANLPYASMHYQVWNQDGTVVMDFPHTGAARLEPAPAHRAFMLASRSRSANLASDPAAPRIWVKTELPRASGTGLQLALNVVESDLSDHVDRQFRRALIGLSVLALVIFGAATLLGELAVRRQTQRMMQTIARIDAGDYTPSRGGYARGELGQVMQALDRMARSLDQQRKDIALNTEALQRQARIDPLTGLANRHMLADRLEQALSYAKRNSRVAAVLMLDLDRFKTINDSLGHSQGDALLKIVAERLQACVREDDTVARLGGDEFVLLLADMSNPDDAVPVAKKILRALAEPAKLGPQVLSVCTSIGIALYPRDGDTADTLLRQADTAMYRAKDQGGNAMTFFSPEMMDVMLERLRLEAGLRRGLEAGEFVLHYQPVIDARSGRVIAAEALIRWNTPEQGLVQPYEFIPLAEETGLIVEIGDWVLREASRQARAWQAMGLGDLPVAVNLSARQFSVPNLDQSVAAALAASDCPPLLLHLEITESAIMDREADALATMDRLKQLGVHLTIDDFGTGYSSLSKLKSFPVSTLKIDRSFVRDVTMDANSDILVESVLSLAQKLGLFTIAEGVETERQKAFLANLQCDAYQGYLFARPCSADDFRAIVHQRNFDT